MTKLRSDITRQGLSRTPHRAFMRAMGLDDEAIAKPMIGVVSMKGEQTPCNMTHGFQVEAAKQGIAEAGGTPREFTTISMSDGIGMNHEGMKFSLVSRELIADSIEAVVHGLAYDGLVGFGGCDKTLPGVMMGMLRCNVPAVFIYGGSALPGRFAGRDVTILDSYEGVGAVMTGGLDEAELARLERSCLPTIGACAGQFTANTMAMVSEALGLSVPNVSMIPGVYVERANHARRAGAIVMEALARGGPRPRDIVTRAALGKRLRCRRHDRRIDQRGAAYPGDRARGRYPLRYRRCRRRLAADAVDRRPATRRAFHRQGCARHRRHRRDSARAARRRLSRRQLPDRDRGHDRRDLRGRPPRRTGRSFIQPPRRWRRTAVSPCSKVISVPTVR